MTGTTTTTAAPPISGPPGRAWAYTGALLGGAVSVAANVAHSYVPPTGAPADWQPPLGAVAVSVFWPLALFVVVEIFARIHWPAGHRWVLLRFGGLLPVAAVAAIVSYRHLSGLLAYYGEAGLTAHIGPLAVDGLMVMATGALVATGAPRHQAIPTTVTTAATSGVATPTTVTAPPRATGDDTRTPVVSTRPNPTTPRRGDTRPPRPRPPRGAATPGTSTRDRVHRVASREPEATPAQIAARLGVSERTVQRHLAATPAPAPAPEAAPAPTTTDTAATPVTATAPA